MQPIDLNPHDLDIVRAILMKFVPDREVWAFGSRVKWTAKPFSDLDLAIVGDQPLPNSVIADLTEAFDESELPIKVDVVDWATTSESFRKIIQTDKVVVQPREIGAVSTTQAYWGDKGALTDVPNTQTSRTQVERISMRSLSSLVVKVIDNRGKTCPVEKHGKPLIATNCIRNELLFPSKETSRYVSESTYKNWFRGHPIPDDLIFVTKGSPGRVSLAPNPVDFCIAQDMVALRADQKQITARYLFAALRSESAQLEISKLHVGTLIPHFKKGDFDKLLLPVPNDLRVQRAIGDLYYQFSLKAETNCRIRHSLLAMGTAIFKSWCIDFDPVRANVGDESTCGLDAAEVELFSDKLIDSDLGEIPAGWTATTLTDIVAERTGKVGSTNGHVVLSAVASGELKRSAEHFTKQVHSQDTSKYKRVEQWDFAYNPSRINIGSIGMLEEPIVGAVSPVYTVLRPAQGYEWFLRFFLDLPQTKEVINQFCSGSVRQSLSFKDFAAIPVVLPPKEIAEAFTRRWQELNALRQHLEVESDKLAEVRDTLLPKLMSGELRVPDELMA